MNENQPEIVFVHEDGEEYPIETDFEVVELTAEVLESALLNSAHSHLRIAPADHRDEDDDE